jgi:septum formation protein
MDNIKIILASASPRRQQMLSWILPEFESMPADIDETPRSGEMPVPYCERMALGKTLHCVDQVPDADFVIGSDTTVCIDRQILGKPKDNDEAEEMLRLLNGREHLVCTSAVLAHRKGNSWTIRHTVSETTVRFREMGRGEILDYVASGDPMGKAGAYAIQNRAFHPVESIRGCYAAVMGFPLCHVRVLFHLCDYETFPMIRSACEAGTKYPCTYIPAVNVSEVPGAQGVF